MKRITLLVVLVLAIALPAVASDFTWSGELEYGAISDFTNAADGYGYARINMKAAVDANNSINARFETLYKGTEQAVITEVTTPTSTTISAFVAYFSRFYMTNDLGKILGLGGVSLVDVVGWTDTTGSGGDLTKYGYEGIIAWDPGTRDTIQLTAGFGAPFSLLVCVSPITSKVSGGTLYAWKPQLLVNATGSFGPIAYVLGYSSFAGGGGAGTTDYMGALGGALTFSQAMGDVTPAVNVEAMYDLGAKAFSMGAGVTVAYKTMATLGFGTAINLSPAPFKFGLTSIELQTNPFGPVYVDGFVALENWALNAIDVSVAYKAGVTVRLGYYYQPTTATTKGEEVYAPAQSLSGVYIDFDLPF
jgi:hypothetical protein